MNTKSNWLTLAAGAAALVLTACGGGGGGGGGSTSPALSPATNPAAGTGTQAANLTSSTATSLSSIAGGASAPKMRSPLANNGGKTSHVNKAAQRAYAITRAKSSAAIRKAVGLAGKTRAPIALPNDGVPQACTDGGTATFTGTYDPDNFSYSINAVYANCREFDSQLNGTVSESGSYTAEAISNATYDSGTYTATTNDFVVEFFTNNYTVLYGRYTSDLSLSGSYGHSSTFVDPVTSHTWTYGIAATGNQTYTDFLDTFAINLSGFQVASNWTQSDAGTPNDFADDTWNSTDTFNGGIAESWSGSSISMSYTNFVVGWLMPGTGGYFESTIDGTVGMVFNPEVLCGTTGVSGIYEFDTTTPIRYDLATGDTTAGRMTINTTTVIVFNADGTVTVTVNGGAPQNYASLDAMEALCAIQDADADQGTVTDMSTAPLPLTVSGTTLIGNLSWTPNEFNDQTGTVLDLHVNYYSTSTPNSSTVGTWYIDYHNRDVSGVLPDNGSDGNLPYYSANNTTTDSEATDFDRLAIDGLPAGYYVISVNSWDLGSALSVTGTVSLKIGANTYAFPTNTFTTADIEGTDPASWWRVCDLVVDGGGNVTIKAPDTSLTPWHTGTFGFAPATSKAMRMVR